MKVLVISDSHGSYEKMRDLFYDGDWNAVIFLGDGLREADRLCKVTRIIKTCF